MKRTRVLLADPDAIVLEGVRHLLEPDFEVVATVEEGQSLLVRAAALRPDLIVLETSLPLVNGLDAARRLRASLRRARVVFLSANQDPAIIEAAFRAGASAYVLKACSGRELGAALRRALTAPEGERWLVRKGARQRWVESRPLGRKPSRELTARQREVVQLVAQGRPLKEVAALLGVSVKTAEFHKYQAMERIGVHSTADLVRYAIRHGLSSI